MCLCAGHFLCLQSLSSPSLPMGQDQALDTLALFPPGEVISLSLEILQYFVSTTYCFKLYSLIFLIKKQTLGEKIYALCIIMSLRKPNALLGI